MYVIRKFEFDLKDKNCYRIYWSFDKISAISIFLHILPKIRKTEILQNTV